MIVAHLSDLHLGFRAYDRIERGVDMRERDVAGAFERAVQEIIRMGPDVVVVAGDVFDRPDPPASAVVALARGLEALRTSLPSAPVLMVAGPRDTPRRPGDPGALAVLDTFPNVEAATSLTRSILMAEMDLHACLVPYRASVRHPPAQPEADPRMAWNLLLVHGSVVASADHGVHVDPAEWDYIALGGEHRRRVLGPNVRFSGSLERVALDPWDEAGDEKGFLTVDLATGQAQFHAIPGRPVVALAPVKVAAGDSLRLQRRVREVMDEVPGGIDGKIVRLRLEGATPRDLLALQGEQLADLRQRALHLAIEAGREPPVPPESWLSGGVKNALRAAVEADLRQAGLLDDATTQLLEGFREDSAPDDLPSMPIGAIEALDGTVPGVGRVSTSIPMGLTAVIGGSGGARRGVAQLLIDKGGGAAEGSMRRLWAGVEIETLEDAVRNAVAAVAVSRGIHLVDVALDRLGSRTRAPAAAESTSPGDGEGPSLHDPTEVSADLAAADVGLRTLRADVVEVDGDLEVATMDWLRERQDAETTLKAFRDRARELRARVRTMEETGPEAPCPTCGRVLESHYQEVLDDLGDQWEAVVQDGGWWRSRWEQLELKPTRLQEIEGSSLRLHAALEEASERVELLRARLADVDRRDTSDVDVTERGGALGAVVDALRHVRIAREARASELLLDRASRFLCRISGGRILAVTRDEGAVALQGERGVMAPVAQEDLAAARIATRLAAVSLVAARGRLMASLVVEEPFDRMDRESRTRTLILMRKLLHEAPRMVLFTHGEAVDARPELFDCVLEVREDASDVGPALRPTPAGLGRTILKKPLRTGRAAG